MKNTPKKYAIYWLCLLIATQFLACGEHLITIEEINDILIDDCALFSQNEYIINDVTTYNGLLAEMQNTPECGEVALPNIDFGEKTLLGKLTATNNVCNLSYKREVLANTDEKEYIYKITISAQGNCADNYASMNWITVPKMPSDYTIVYEVINE